MAETRKLAAILAADCLHRARTRSRLGRDAGRPRHGRGRRLRWVAFCRSQSAPPQATDAASYPDHT